jgi:L-fuculose-phosphate aldolase
MKTVEEIIKYGRLVEKYGLIASHSGNISVRNNDYIYITKTGTMLGDLKESDIIKVSLFNDDDNIKQASMETVVHKAIYLTSHCNAILHTHPVYTIALSLLLDELTPVDSEGKLILGNVSVLKAKQTVASKEVADKIPQFFKQSKIVIIRGHGAFSVGNNLEKAFYYTSVLENSSKIYYLTKLWTSLKHF